MTDRPAPHETLGDLARADIKLIADALVRAKAGPNAIVTEMNGGGSGIDLDKFDTPEARAAAQRRTGIGG